jgi:hypothetical protein
MFGTTGFSVACTTWHGISIVVPPIVVVVPSVVVVVVLVDASVVEVLVVDGSTPIVVSTPPLLVSTTPVLIATVSLVPGPVVAVASVVVPGLVPVVLTVASEFEPEPPVGVSVTAAVALASVVEPPVLAAAEVVPIVADAPPDSEVLSPPSAVQPNCRREQPKVSVMARFRIKVPPSTKSQCNRKFAVGVARRHFRLWAADADRSLRDVQKCPLPRSQRSTAEYP